MLVNLKLLCSGYLYDVSVDRQYEYITKYTEIYGGVEHGLMIYIKTNFDARIYIHTYVHGVKHGGYYDLPYGTALAAVASGNYPVEFNNYFILGHFKKNKKHGIWRTMYGSGYYEDTYYENGKQIKSTGIDINGFVSAITTFKHNSLSEYYTFHTNGQIKTYERYINHVCVEFVVYDEQGRLLKCRKK